MAKHGPGQAACRECRRLFPYPALPWQPRPTYCSLRCAQRAETRAARADAGLPDWLPALLAEKRCPHCGVMKPLEAFVWGGSGAGGDVSSWCRECRNARRRKAWTNPCVRTC
jgi:hypothetical protein